MKFRQLLLVCCLFFAGQEIFAQSYLVLRKKGSQRKYEYFPGNEFIYKMRGMDEFFRDRITDFADSTIILENNILRINQIVEVDIRNAKSNRPDILRSAESILPVAGILFFVIDFVNYAWIDGKDYEFDRGVNTASAIMVGTGLGLKLVRKKFFKLNKPNREAYIVGLP